MEYYHDLVTQKSWSELQKLRKTIDFILIGGWAVYLYTKALKSKDIDIVVNFDQLPKLNQNYSLSKNVRLKKYEAVKEEVQINIYLPHYSNLGIPVEDLISQTQNVEGFKLLDPNFLAVLKIHTLSQRGRSPKGRKDLIDLLAMISTKKCDLAKIKKIIKQYHRQNELGILKEFLGEQEKIPELNLNPHHYSKIKKEILSGLPSD